VARREYLFNKELIQKFLELCDTTPVNEAIEILKKEFPEIIKVDKPLKYWNQIANRSKRSRAAAPRPKKPAQMALPVEEIKPTTPDVEVPSYVVFGSNKLPLDAIRYYHTEILHCERSRKDIVQSIRERFPSIAQISDPTIPNFFTLRFGSCKLSVLSKIGKEELERMLQMQSRNQLVTELYAQKWRDSAIAEKAAELFPSLEPISTSEIKEITTHRIRANKISRQTRKENRIGEPREIKKVTTWSVKLLGPNMHYEMDLTPDQAKDLLKKLLEF